MSNLVFLLLTVNLSHQYKFVFFDAERRDRIVLHEHIVNLGTTPGLNVSAAEYNFVGHRCL